MARNSSLLRPASSAARSASVARASRLSRSLGGAPFLRAVALARRAQRLPRPAVRRCQRRQLHRLAAAQRAGGGLERVDRLGHVAGEVPGDEGASASEASRPAPTAPSTPYRPRLASSAEMPVATTQPQSAGG
jgi:hypothetical protein